MKKVRRELPLPMQFNPALLRYEPNLPLKKSENRNKKIKIDWAWIIILLVLLALFIAIIISF